MLPILGRIGRRRPAVSVSSPAWWPSMPAPAVPTGTETESQTPWACRACSARYFASTAVSAGPSTNAWKTRQTSDPFARQAKVMGLKSRAAFKLLEINKKYHLFKPNQTVVDLGYAPGSWSQVAVEMTKPHGRVVGIDLIPAQPPRGVSTIQGNFLSPAVRNMLKELLAQPPALPKIAQARPKEVDADDADDTDADADSATPATNDTVAVDRLSYLESERQATATAPVHDTRVDVVLSDMLMNTSGNKFSDHAGSMDLCLAALEFASDTLRAGGHFVCKFYQGGEDRDLEKRLKKMFSRVVREKPEASRSESKESFFVALRKKKHVKWDDIKDL